MMEVDSRSIEVLNLQCAVGLAGAEDLAIPACLGTLDQWTESVRRYTADSIARFHARPQDYQHHEGVFRFIAMVTLLKHPRGLGIRYQPTAIGNFRFTDSRDDFLHGPLTRRLGTCVSLPVLFVAISRRLGYPMHLAVAKGHVMCQWLDDRGRINLEGSCPGGGEALPDEHYHTWPRPLTAQDLATGRYLRPLKPNEELALFLETRGHCLVDNGHFEEARQAYDQARDAAPDWSQYEGHTSSLALHERLAERGRGNVRDAESSRWPQGIKNLSGITV